MVWGTGFFKGLAVTAKNFVRGPVTLNYPDERFELPERSRWAVKPLYDADGELLCTACMNCVRECPDNVLALEVSTDEDKNKTIDSFTYEIAACMFCGLCVEKCPFSALEMSHDYELAVWDTSGFTQVFAEGVPAARPKRKKKDAEPKADTPAAEPARDGEGGDGS